MAALQRRTCAEVRPAVVTFPAEVDVCNTGRLGLELGAALASAATVIADMTATTFCDCSGVRALLLAHQQAAADGSELRLVAHSTGVLRILALTGAGRISPIYPTVAAALAQKPTPDEPGRRQPVPVIERQR